MNKFSKVFYYIWLFGIGLIFLTVMFRLIRFGLSPRVILGIAIVTAAIFFLRKFKQGIK